MLDYKKPESILFKSLMSHYVFWRWNITIQFKKWWFPFSVLTKYTVDYCCLLISAAVFISLGQQSLTQPYTKGPTRKFRFYSCGCTKSASAEMWLQLSGSLYLLSLNTAEPVVYITWGMNQLLLLLTWWGILIPRKNLLWDFGCNLMEV